MSRDDCEPVYEEDLGTADPVRKPTKHQLLKKSQPIPEYVAESPKTSTTGLESGEALSEFSTDEETKSDEPVHELAKPKRVIMRGRLIRDD